MEFARRIERRTTTHIQGAGPANDNHQATPSSGRSVFPRDAVARIFRPSRSVTTSAKARNAWRLVLEQRSPSLIEPLMGYIGSRDTLKQVELRFPTLDSAVRYAQRQGLAYVVQSPHEHTVPGRRATQSAHAFSDATLERLGLADLRQRHGLAHEQERAGTRSHRSLPEAA